MRMARRFRQAVASAAGHHIANRRFQADPVTGRDVQRFDAGPGSQRRANDLAIQAATHQVTSAGITESGYDAWLEKKQAARLFPGYDPDVAFAALETRLAAGERFPIKEG